MHVSVQHWRYEDGKPEWVGKTKIYPTGYRDPVPAGWYCWAYPNNDREFEKWMKTNCPTSDFQHRFNGGDPMYTVQIKNDQEAVIFKLQWM
jgi:hypothetical protein